MSSISQEKNIVIESAGSFDRNQSLYPDGNILSESANKKVHLTHDNMDIFSKKSIFFKKETLLLPPVMFMLNKVIQ